MLGNDDGSLCTMQNGYALCTESGLEILRRKLGALSPAETDAVRDLLRIGVHWNAQEPRDRRVDGLGRGPLLAGSLTNSDGSRCAPEELDPSTPRAKCDGRVADSLGANHRAVCT